MYTRSIFVCGPLHHCIYIEYISSRANVFKTRLNIRVTINNLNSLRLARKSSDTVKTRVRTYIFLRVVK